MEKIQINVNATRIQSQDFERNVENVMIRCNELIDQFHNFQPWKKIAFIEDFIKLCQDPAGLFDQLLIENSGFKTAGTNPDPEKIAQLISVDRTNWLNLVAGKPLKTECKPCHQVMIRQGQSAVSYQIYKDCKSYLTFDNGVFDINDDAVKEKRESFKIYASTPQQIKTVRHFQELSDCLNYHLSQGFCGPSVIQECAKLLDLRFVENRTYLNDELISGLITKQK